MRRGTGGSFRRLRLRRGRGSTVDDVPYRGQEPGKPSYVVKLVGLALLLGPVGAAAGAFAGLEVAQPPSDVEVGPVMVGFLLGGSLGCLAAFAIVEWGERRRR